MPSETEILARLYPIKHPAGPVPERVSTSKDEQVAREAPGTPELIEHPLRADSPKPSLPTHHADGTPHAAFSGLAGEFTRTVAPDSEADPAGVLLHTLIASGCLIGAGPHVLVEHMPHYARLNAILVGRTAAGRKGTAWSHPKALFQLIDKDWVSRRVKSGLSSGEGMIYLVRDPDEHGDAGEPDKRLLLIEPEFASTLKSLQRDGNTLSPKIRDAWDHGTLSPLTKRERITATGAHICTIAHSTQEELLRELATTDRTNGFANRFLFAWVEKSKDLPHGKGAPRDTLLDFSRRFEKVLAVARTRGELDRDEQANELWESVYPDLNAERPGMTGAILSRAPAQVLRLSLIYALLDEGEAATHQPAIRASHLAAALDVWDYCEASAVWIFGDLVGDPIADRLLHAIKQGPQSDTDLWEAVGGMRCDQGRKEAAVDLLLRLRRIHGLKIPTVGRPLHVWHYGASADCETCKKGKKGVGGL